MGRESCFYREDWGVSVDSNSWDDLDVSPLQLGYVAELADLNMLRDSHLCGSYTVKLFFRVLPRQKARSLV